MNFNFLLVLAALAFSNLTFSSSSDVLTIGCSTKCDIFYKFAIKTTARAHKQKVRIIDLSKQEKINWKELDGIMMPGGADIDPKYYLHAVEPELVEYTKKLDYLVNYSAEGRRRDPIEYGILKEYFQREDAKNIPILGICRGMQMLAVSQGIPLYVDIKKELGIRNRRYVFDWITLEGRPESVMNDLFDHSFRAFKQHHQGIRVAYYQKNIERWPHLYVSSYSHGGKIAESLEFKNRPILGVQFHSEKDFGYERHTIFGWFLDQAEARKQAKLLNK